MTGFVSLFRGINVGGNNQVRMVDLKVLYESLGFKDVVSYIQSGNVVFQADGADTAQIKRQIEDGFEQRFGFHSEVMLRTAAELREIISHNPFQGQGNKESKWVVVLFLATRPDPAAQEALVKAYAGPEEFFFSGTELYLYYPTGMGRSKLTGAFIEKKLKTAGTARNWNTVLQLHQLLEP